MTGPRSQVKGDDGVLMLLDISRAHLHSLLARAVFVTIDGKVYKLLKAMYGLRDAGAAFDRKVLGVMNLMSGKVQHLCWIPESARDMPR